MHFDLIIRNGTLVDGTGKPGFAGDIGVRDGRIATTGVLESGATARESVDATGRVVCPGFVDPHTHYDAQISWDPLLSSSTEHGVTTVMLGNCGVGVAPCRPADRDLMVQDLVNVESMAEEVLKAGVKWNWESFPEYMDAVARQGSGPNCAFLAPLAPLRTYVAGEAASDRASTPDETATAARLLRDAMEAGAYGFSSTAIPSHIGHHGKPLSARLASDDELKVYCGVLRDMKRGAIELALTKRFNQIADDEIARLDMLLDASQRPITWLSLHNLAERPDGVAEVLSRAAGVIRRGALPQILTRPLISEMTLRRPFQFGELACAKVVFDRTADEQIAIYADPAFRRAFFDELKLGRKFTNQARSMTVYKVGNPALAGLAGRTIGDIAAERGCSPEDMLFDLAVEDRVGTQFLIPRANTNQERIPELLRESGRTLIGLSDGGAHVDMFCEAGYTTWLLGHWVREKRAMTLEHAIQRITSEPADFFGIRDRGRLAVGHAADIVVFDPARIGSPARGTMVNDLPAGGGRLYAKAEGIDAVYVNGKALFGKGAHTGALPGTVLRAA